MNNNPFTAKRFSELSEKAYGTNRYYFTDFLTPEEQSELNSLRLDNVTVFGGAEGCERVMARFGKEEDFGYEQPFPLACIEAVPVSPEFSRELTHRDFLGSLMALGIERKCVGDIILQDGKAYIFCVEKLADYICENLVSVGRTRLTCGLSALPDESQLFRTEHMTVNVASLRVDCIVGAVYHLSRNHAEAYFDAQAVFINGRVCSKSDTPKENDRISVRRLGKFIFLGQSGISKKGRLYADIEKYV